jgi:predicted TIM-barrel enzyme
VADGAIVGSYLKVGGRAARPVDPGRARDLVAAAAAIGWR